MRSAADDLAARLGDDVALGQDVLGLEVVLDAVGEEQELPVVDLDVARGIDALAGALLAPGQDPDLGGGLEGRLGGGFGRRPGVWARRPGSSKRRRGCAESGEKAAGGPAEEDETPSADM